MSKFESKFQKCLLEDLDDEAAFEASLDKGVSGEDYATDVEPNLDPDNANVSAASAISVRNDAMHAAIKSWVDHLDGTLQFLNSEQPDSVQSQLAAAEPDTILDRMKQSEQRKIARVATELASLTESFRGYLAQSNNAQFKYV